MRDAPRDFVDHLHDIPNNARKLKAFLGDQRFDAFEADEKTRYAIARALEIIGEATKRIPKEFRERQNSPTMSPMRIA